MDEDPLKSIRNLLSEIRPDPRWSSDEDARLFLAAINAGDLDTIGQMLQTNPDLLFIDEDYYGSPVRAATDSPYPEIADYLARFTLQRLRDGTIPKAALYGAIHDLGEAAHADTGYRGCEKLRAEAEPIVSGFLAHDDSQLRYIAVSVLSTHWDLNQYVHVVQRMSVSDPDEHVRDIALSSVGWLLRGTRDRDGTLFLLGVFRDLGQSASTREEAYEGLVEVWQGFDAGFALFQTKLRAEEPLRAAERNAQTVEEKKQIDMRIERVWEDFVDADFLARVARETEKGSEL